jgi:hypothetical protein
MQNGISLGNGQVLTINLTIILIVFAAALIVLVIAVLYISMNVSRIAKSLEQKGSNQDSHGN